jgi:hypothetical protein
MFVDYQCSNCEELCIETHRTKDGDPIPETMIFECVKERDNGGARTICEFKRHFGRVCFDIGEGLHGNAKNGYSSSNTTYKASSLTPLSKIPGRKKSDSVLSDKSMW